MQWIAGYIRWHWRGELPLSASFWINNVILDVLVVGVAYSISRPSRPLEVGWFYEEIAGDYGFWFIVAAQNIIAIFLVVARIWQWCGLWRSATKSAVAHGTVVWPLAAKSYVMLQLVLVLGVLLSRCARLG